MKTRLAYRLLTEDNGPLVFLVRLLLLPFYLLYVLIVTARNALYDGGLLPTVNVGVPVLSVGNLTVGGTGKTPLVIALAKHALSKGKRVAVVARGYGAAVDDAGRTDEVNLVSDRVPEAVMVVAPDKTVGAQRAAEQGVDVILVDDGMQHRRLERDLNIVVVDARAPFGNGNVLPLGPLREPPSGLARADLFVLTHFESLEPEDLEDVRIRLTAYRRDVPVVFGRHDPTGVRPASGGAWEDPSTLAGREVFLFCGIASPEGFRQTVEALGARVTGILPFGDHHAFGPDDLAAVRAEARTAQLLCTEKDAAKVARIPGSSDVLCLTIDMNIVGDMPPLPGIDT